MSSWALAGRGLAERTERAEERRDGVCLVESSDGSESRSPPLKLP